MKSAKIWIATLAIATVACGRSDKPVVGFDISALDSSAAPCDDFFQFTAGGWIADNPIPPTEGRWTKFDQLAKENQKKVRAIFDDLLKKRSPGKGSDEQLVGDMYRSGMDSAYIEDLGFAPVAGMMERLNDANSIEEWLYISSDLYASGVRMPISVYVGPDDKNSEMNILQMSQSGLGLPDRSYYLDTTDKGRELQKKYIEHIARMFQMYGDHEDNSMMIAREVYEFEKSLAAAQWDRVTMRNRDTTYNKMTRGEMEDLLAGLPVQLVFDVLGIYPEDVIVKNPLYYRKLAEMSASWDPRVLANYSRWHILHAYAGSLHHDVVAEDFRFYGQVLNGLKEMKPRWQRVQDAMNGLSEQIGHLYVDEYFPAEQKEEIEGMVEDLRTAFRARIRNLTWMSDETKERALVKLDAFKYKIGYPDEWKDYSDLVVESDDYFGNVRRLGLYRKQENLARIGQPVDKSEWFMGAHIVNAYYSSSFNEIVFPAGILQPPFYIAGADAAINYGAIGGVIGHEFTHGFDDQGSKYDAHGNLSNWWTEGDRDRFEELANKVVEQYDSYEALPGKFVNGKLTLGENIADHGGLTLAYHAYLHHMEGKPVPEPIDGFTHTQRVFLGWAQVWQGHMTDEALAVRLNTDPHSPGRFRVNGPAANLPEFYENFGCQPGEGLVLPEEKRATIW